MTKIKILDFLCGQGKSTFIKKMVKDNPNDLYLYIAPYLSECHRFAGTTFEGEDDRKKPKFVQDSKVVYEYAELGEYDIDISNLNFRHPNTKNKEGSKELSLCSLLSQRKNIVSTHALFTDLGSNAIDCAKDYTLIIDETVNVYELDNRSKDIDWGLETGVIYIGDDGVTLRFSREKFAKRDDGEDSAKGSRYEDLAFQCDLGQLLYINGKTVVWELSVDLLKSFKEVWVCTYMFEGSDMSSYFKKHELLYEYVDLPNTKTAKTVAHLIEVVDDGKLNLIGEITNLTATASKLEKEQAEKYGKISKDVIKDTLKKNLHNIFNQKWKAKADDRLWTCFKDQQKAVSGGRYGNQFLAFNYKATNEFVNVHHVAFMLDVRQNPIISQVCKNRGITTSNDHFAISTLIQFIFRSAVRNGESIKLYLPSLRMRELLKDWKEAKFDTHTKLEKQYEN